MAECDMSDVRVPWCMPFDRKYRNRKEFAGEDDVHVLEDLTGGLVSPLKVSLLRKKSIFNKINSAVKAGLPVICRKRQVTIHHV